MRVGGFAWFQQNTQLGLSASVESPGQPHRTGVCVDHLAWVSSGGHYFKRSASLPLQRAVLNYVADRIQQGAGVSGGEFRSKTFRPTCSFQATNYSEWQFLADWLSRPIASVT